MSEAAKIHEAGTFEEVVTHTPVRDIALPGDAGTLALITLDNGFDHTKPNTFGPQTIAGLQTTVAGLRERAEAGEIQAVGITGKPFIFAVGADLKAVAQATRREQALEVARAGQRRSARSWTFRSRRSRSSTARPWAAASRSP